MPEIHLPRLIGHLAHNQFAAGERQKQVGLTHLNLSLRAQRGNLVARASTQLRKS